MGLFDIFDRPVQFTEEEVSRLKQSGFFVNDNRMSAQPPANPGARLAEDYYATLQKYPNYFFVKTSYRQYMNIGMLDIQEQSFGSSEKCQTLEDAINWLKNG